MYQESYNIYYWGTSYIIYDIITEISFLFLINIIKQIVDTIFITYN